MNYTIKTLYIGVISAIITTTSSALAGTADSLSSQQAFTEYYRIEETAEVPETFSIADNFLSLSKRAVLNLLKLTRFTDQFVAPQEKYDRRLHFGRWINDPLDDTCQNTRAKVLVRDSVEPVTFRNDKKCVVDAGRWQDQYTGLEFNNARQIQVDHFVPLKHAWTTGASNWDFKARCLYSNFLGNKIHLVPVNAHENMSKGDSGPDRYVPPNEVITCDYLKNWMKIKLAWRLVLPAHEVAAIQDLIKENHCDPKSFTASYEEIAETRLYIQSNLDYCLKNRRQ